MMAPTLWRGLSEPNGSWKTICRSRRRRFRGAAAEAEQVLALEQHLAAARLDQPQDGAAEGRFSAPGFADDAEHLAPRERQAHAVERPHRRAAWHRHRTSTGRGLRAASLMRPDSSSGPGASVAFEAGQVPRAGRDGAHGSEA